MPALTRFSADRRERLLGMVSAGMPLTEAAAEVGVSRTTVDRWAGKGRREQGTDYAEFAQRLEQARHGPDRPLTRGELVRLLERSARKGSIRAAELLLKRPWEKQRPAETPKDPFAELDELAQKRRKRRTATTTKEEQ